MKFVVLSALIFALTACIRHTGSSPVYYDVPAFDLIAQTGQAIPQIRSRREESVREVDFIYTTCPGPCSPA